MGFGFDKAGQAPAGLGTPIEGLSVTYTGFGASTTGAVSSLKIDPVTRDYVFDEKGTEQGMNDSEQRVWCCLQTMAQSRVGFPNDGLALPKAIGDNIRTEIEEAIRVALRPVLDDGSITLASVEVEAVGTKVFAAVKWRDTRTSTEVITRTPLRK